MNSTMSASARSYFEAVAKEFRRIAVRGGYHAVRGVRVSLYAGKVRFRLHDARDIIRSGVFHVDDTFANRIPAYEAAQRIYDALCEGFPYVIGRGERPKQFDDFAALTWPEALKKDKAA